MVLYSFELRESYISEKRLWCQVPIFYVDVVLLSDVMPDFRVVFRRMAWYAYGITERIQSVPGQEKHTGRIIHLIKPETTTGIRY